MSCTMPTPRKPRADAAGRDPTRTRSKGQRSAASASDPSAGARKRKSARKSAKTVPVSVDVPKGMVLVPVTPAEAAELESKRLLASKNRLFRLMPRDWKTPLALLVTLAAVLVTGITDERARTVFDVATAISVVWLVLSLIARAADALMVKANRPPPGPTLK